MEWTDIALYVLAAVLMLVGLAGTILPALPGVPLVFIGMLLAAWVGDFQTIGVWTLVLLGVLTLLALAADLIATALGAKRAGASGLAMLGAGIGMIVGMFFGLIGLLFGPFFGAVAGELLATQKMHAATRVGVGTWLGLFFGTLAKLALCFTMFGVFALALLIG